MRETLACILSLSSLLDRSKQFIDAVFYSIGLRSLYVDRGQVLTIRTTLGKIKINGISAGPVLSIQLLKTPLE